MSNELEILEREIESNKEEIDRDETLARLWKNKDFQKIIVEGYLTEHVLDLVKQRATPVILSSPDLLKIQDATIAGVGFLHQYLNKVEQNGQRAKFQLEQNNATKAEILQEED